MRSVNPGKKPIPVAINEDGHPFILTFFTEDNRHLVPCPHCGWTIEYRFAGPNSLPQLSPPDAKAFVHALLLAHDVHLWFAHGVPVPYWFPWRAGGLA